MINFNPDANVIPDTVDDNHSASELPGGRSEGLVGLCLGEADVEKKSEETEDVKEVIISPENSQADGQGSTLFVGDFPNIGHPLCGLQDGDHFEVESTAPVDEEVAGGNVENDVPSISAMNNSAMILYHVSFHLSGPSGRLSKNKETRFLTKARL